jgi:hypothetical protein
MSILLLLSLRLLYEIYAGVHATVPSLHAPKYSLLVAAINFTLLDTIQGTKTLTFLSLKSRHMLRQGC